MHPLVDAFIQGRAKFKKKEVGNYFDDLKKPRAACHVGAIYYGVYRKTTDRVQLLTDDFPELRHLVKMPCDDTEHEEGWVSSILIHLNDYHDGRNGWTDQKVAEWLGEALK